MASTIALLEVLVLPLRHNDQQLVQAYRDILQNNARLTLIPVSAAVAERAARLRADGSIRTPDALHLATALTVGARTFITNDMRLPSIPGLEIISLDAMIEDNQA